MFTIEELKKQQERIDAYRAEVYGKRKNLERDLERAKKAVLDARGLAMRTGEFVSLNAAKDRVLELEGDLEEIQESLKTADVETVSITRELADAKHRELEALNQRVSELSSNIEDRIKSDKKTRSLLLEITGLWLCFLKRKGNGNVHWDFILENAFPWPTEEELEQAALNAEKQLGDEHAA